MRLTLCFRWGKFAKPRWKRTQRENRESSEKNGPLRIVSDGADLRTFFLLKSSERKPRPLLMRSEIVLAKEKDFHFFALGTVFLDISRILQWFYRISTERSRHE